MYISNRRDFLNKIIKVFSIDKKLKSDTNNQGQ